jgi:excisionase family DNA binding protein
MTTQDPAGRIRAALAELGDALLEAVGDGGNNGSPAPLVSSSFASIAEACEITGISRSALYDSIARGEIASRKLGRRRLIPRSELERLADVRRHGDAASRADGADQLSRAALSDRHER